MNWVASIATLAAVLHTPVDVVWRMTLGQFLRYCNELPGIVQLTTPFAALGGGGGGEEIVDADENPDAVLAIGKAFGIYRSEGGERERTPAEAAAAALGVPIVGGPING